MTKHDQRFEALFAGASPQSQFDEFFKWLRRLQRAVQDGLPSREHVIKLRALFEAMHLINDVLADQKTRSADDMFVLCELRTELPIVFYAFCRRLSVDASLSEEECDPEEVEAKLNSPAASEVWQRLQAAAMCDSRSPESLERWTPQQWSDGKKIITANPDIKAKLFTDQMKPMNYQNALALRRELTSKTKREYHRD